MSDAVDLKIDVDQASVKAIREALGRFAGDLNRHLATAVNRTARTVGVEAAQQLGKIVNFKMHSTNKGNTSKTYSKARMLKKAVINKNRATPDAPSATIKLWKGHPFPLKLNEAYEYNKKRKGKVIRSGVRYKAEVGGGWASVLDGFIVRGWGGNVYQRVEGSRSIRKLKGKTPGDYFLRANVPAISGRVAAERLPIEIKRRLRDVTMAAAGKIKLRASKDLGAN